MKEIRVTGILYIEDHEHDPGPNGPLTEEAHDKYFRKLGLDDLQFEEETA
jgi:hypothetical protein